MKKKKKMLIQFLKPLGCIIAIKNNDLLDTDLSLRLPGLVYIWSE